MTPEIIARLEQRLAAQVKVVQYAESIATRTREGTVAPSLQSDLDDLTAYREQVTQAQFDLELQQAIEQLAKEQQ